jgi:hypothetical protein
MCQSADTWKPLRTTTWTHGQPAVPLRGQSPLLLNELWYSSWMRAGWYGPDKTPSAVHTGQARHGRLTGPSTLSATTAFALNCSGSL